jgi:hypothetical protein
MSSFQRSIAAGALLAVLLGCGLAAAQDFQPVKYELLPGSKLIDDCFCDRLPIEAPIAGSLVLTRLPVFIAGELYSITDLVVNSAAPDPEFGLSYLFRGTGEYFRNDLDVLRNSMQLTLGMRIGDFYSASDIKLTSELLPVASEWPRIEISVREDGQRDPGHIVRLELLLAPSADTVRYELVPGDLASFEGSIFIDDCTICGRPTIPVAVGGEFFLRRTGGGGPNPITEFAIEGLKIESLVQNQSYTITGGGTYSFGGEVALLQSMVLEVNVNDDRGAILAAAGVPFPAGVAFPAIDIQLEHRNPAGPIHVYSLRVVAKPTGELPPPRTAFRRGDANDDGKTDISDPVNILVWRFNGGPEPGCLEAADVNGDAKHDITDPVYLLVYLFQGGFPPPAPGAEGCGVVEGMEFGCEVSLGCGGG